MAFRAVALQGLVAALLAQVVAVALALLGGGVWALVAPARRHPVGDRACSRGGAPAGCPRSCCRRAQFRAHGGVRAACRPVSTSSRRLRNLAESWIVAVTLGTPALGLLNIGQRLVQVAQELTAASLSPVSTVVFARVRESADRLRGPTSRHSGLRTPSSLP